MKLFAAAAIVLVAGSSLSHGANTTPVRQTSVIMIIPSEHNDSPFDFNPWRLVMINLDELACRTTSSTTCDAITRIIPRSSAIRN